ncbi:MAG: hypothetical protein WCI37_03650, partial [bacterium]
IFSSQVGKGSIFGFTLPITTISFPRSAADISSHQQINIGMGDDEKLVNNIEQKSVDDSIISQNPQEKESKLK